MTESAAEYVNDYIGEGPVNKAAANELDEGFMEYVVGFFEDSLN